MATSLTCQRRISWPVHMQILRSLQEGLRGTTDFALGHTFWFLTLRWHFAVPPPHPPPQNHAPKRLQITRFLGVLPVKSLHMVICGQVNKWGATKGEGKRCRRVCG